MICESSASNSSNHAFEGRFRLDIRKKFFLWGWWDTGTGCQWGCQQSGCQQTCQQRGCGCPHPGSFQGEVEWGFEQRGLEGGIPAYSRGLELPDLKGPFQPKPFNDSVILYQNALRSTVAVCFPIVLDHAWKCRDSDSASREICTVLIKLNCHFLTHWIRAGAVKGKLGKPWSVSENFWGLRITQWNSCYFSALMVLN